MPNVKTNLEQILKDRDKTIYALAKEADISYATVNKIAKKDIQSIDLKVLEKICRNLKCEVGEIIKFPSLEK
jgi:DNA-binding Xre family transcriptional regulator